jgi:Predicted sugar phosphatases of the HAD superfamily
VSTTNVIIDSYDAVLFDLDGVVYLGPVAVPGAAEGIAALHDRGIKIGFVTNNAARPPVAVADHLVELGIPATAADVGYVRPSRRASVDQSLRPGRPDSCCRR